MGRFIDLTGQIFSRWTVIKRSPKKEGEKEVYWECKCECGNYSRVRGSLLRNGNSKSCGCLAKEVTSKNFLQDLTNQTFGRLTVLEQGQTKNKKIYWKCRCKCGNIIEVEAYNLKNKHTQSCGCLQRERTSQASLIDLTGQRFGKILVQKYAYSKKGRAYWECLCDCGSQCYIAGAHLTNGRAKSCGCENSYGELKIKTIFNENQINYETQKSYEDLIGLGGGLLRFDFYLPDSNILIEYQGEQHYTSSFRDKNKEDFQKRLIHDNLKRDYCKNKNIKLIEIPYWDYNKISLKYLQERIKESENRC